MQSFRANHVPTVAVGVAHSYEIVPLILLLEMIPHTRAGIKKGGGEQINF